MKYKHLSIEEREIIQTMWWERKSIRVIARVLNRSFSSISRELRRNFPPEHKVYTPRMAHERALKKRKCRGRIDRLKNKQIRSYVVSHLKRRWSPEQIAGRIRSDLNETISHEAIYQYVYHQYTFHNANLKDGAEDLRVYLRRRRKRRVPKGLRRCQRMLNPQGISIDERPEVVNQRQRIGDWEGDTVESKNHKPGINTLVERKVGLVLITKLKTRASYSTTKAITNRFSKLPKKIKHTLTLDNGVENHRWEEIERDTGLSVYFAHPYHSWERGTNENTNGLIREYFPKKTDFTQVSDEEIAKVEYDLNTRPRKRLNWLTPLEAMSVALEG